jgi:opacity protein-like surface antigen
MTLTNRRKLYRWLDRAIVGALLLLVMLMVGIATARAGEIVPSIGMTRAVDGDDQVKMSGGLAFRTNLAPMLMTELGASYRNDEYFNGDLTVHQWPITASLYLTPVPALYAGAGVGWYHTTLDYADALGISNTTDEKFGVHVGGGLQVPLAPMASLDLGGRYVFMEKQESPLVPQKFDPDFWTTSLGLAIKF